MAQKFIVPITIKQLASASSDALTVSIDGDSYGRVKIEAGGRLSWGDGGGTFDTNLYRDSANTLATDDLLKAIAGVVTLTTNGAPTASLPNGTLAVDTTNNVFYFRSNSTWTQVSGGGASVTISDTAPVSPEAGDLWFGSLDLTLYIYYGSVWVAITATTDDLSDLGDVVITSAQTGDLLKWNGTDWVNASGYALLASPTFTGTPTLPTGTIATTQTASDSTTKVATTAFVTTADNLKANLASPTFTGTVTIPSGASISGFAPLASPTFTGTVTVPTPISNTDASTKAYVDSTASTTASNASTALTNHEADTTSIHGIADTSILVTTTGTQTLTNKTITSPSGLVKGDVGLGNVDNTSDANKPVSTAGQTALDLKANLASPTFTGTVTLPNDTVALGTKTTGDYVATITGGTGVTSTAATTGEGTTHTLSIGQAVATNSNVTFNDLTVSGNLTVSGTTTSINTETLTINDNIIVLNNNATSTPTENAGIEVERGTSTNVVLRWNETNDKWEFTNDGTTYSNLGAGGATVSSSAPASPTEGQIWFDNDTAKTFVYYDSSWIEIGAGSGITSVTVSSSPPASPAEGNMWFDSDTAQSFTYYDSQWIELGSSAMVAQVQSSAPTSPIAGQIWFDSDTGGTYIYYGTNWIEVGVAPLNAVLNTYDAKGDIVVATADNTIARLAVGSANQVLTVDSTTATGLKWATPTTYQAVVANVSDTEIGYLDGVTSAIQTQLNNKQAVVANVSDTEIGYLDGVTSAIQTQLNTKASTGKSIAMAIVFGG